jgi:ribonucleotide reductase beta subunit family protein with ferritin-like domain
MIITNTPKIKTPTESYTNKDYPEALDFAEKQNSVFWLHGEVKVEKDKQDLLVNVTPSEKHGVTTVSKLFTRYELFIGEEYWGEIVAKRYPRPEIVRMANAFSFFELNVHAPFYAKLNEELGIATDEFYTSYANDPVLADRMAFIDEMLNSDDELLSLAAFSMIEGAVLYSSFAFLKHFQSNGKNKMMNLVRGINFSVRDENLHAMAGAWLFKKVLEELGLTTPQKHKLFEKIKKVAQRVYEHECRIVDMIFEKGEIPGINAEDLKAFVRSRINICLSNLGVDTIFTLAETQNTIDAWFYRSINNFQFNDFFSGMGNQYNRNWEKTGFIWRGKDKK